VFVLGHEEQSIEVSPEFGRCPCGDSIENGVPSSLSLFPDDPRNPIGGGSEDRMLVEILERSPSKRGQVFEPVSLGESEGRQGDLFVLPERCPPKVLDDALLVLGDRLLPQRILFDELGVDPELDAREPDQLVDEFEGALLRKPVEEADEAELVAEAELVVRSSTAMNLGAVRRGERGQLAELTTSKAHGQAFKNDRFRNGEDGDEISGTCTLQNGIALAHSFAMGLRKSKKPKGDLLGYARVSKGEEQTTRMQTRALKEAGATRVFQEKASGGRWDRPQLHRLLDQLRPGDVVMVWKLDRLSRSLKDLLHILEKIDAADAGFRCLTEPVDTTTPAGRMMMQMIGSFAEFERAMIRERTRAGLEAARAEGRIGGRPSKLNPNQRKEAVRMVRSGKKTSAEVARLFGVHPSTICRVIAAAG